MCFSETEIMFCALSPLFLCDHFVKSFDRHLNKQRFTSIDNLVLLADVVGAPTCLFHWFIRFLQTLQISSPHSNQKRWLTGASSRVKRSQVKALNRQRDKNLFGRGGEKQKLGVGAWTRTRAV